MLEKYSLREQLGKTMFVFEKSGMYYGHIIKDRTEKSPALLVFETAKYESIEQLKAEYPPYIGEV
jgi:hypothetical protein